MDDAYYEKINIAEEETRRWLNIFPSKPSKISIDDIIDIVFGNIGDTFASYPEAYISDRMRRICTAAYYYILTNEKKSSKADKERFKYHTKKLSEKALALKKILYATEVFPKDNELAELHRLLEKVAKYPYDFIPPPDDFPEEAETKKELEETIIFWSSEKFNQRRNVRRAKKIVSEIDALLKKSR